MARPRRRGGRRWSSKLALLVPVVAIAVVGMACGDVTDLPTPNEEPAIWIILDGERIDTLRMGVGESVNLDIENHLGQQIPVQWSVSPSNFATVSSFGQVDAVEVGTALVTAIWSALVTASVTLIVE